VNDSLSDATGKYGLSGLFVLFSLLACLVGMGAYWVLSNAIQERAEQRLSAVAKLKSREIETWLQERFGDARVVASLPDVVQTLARHPGKGSAQSLPYATTLLSEMRAAFRYPAIELLDASARRLLCVGRQAECDHPQPLENAEAIARSTSPVLIDFSRTNNPETPVKLAVANAIRDGNGATAPVVGFVILHIDPDRYLYPLIQSWPVPSHSAESLLVRREGDNALFLNSLRHSAAPPLSLRIPLSRTEVPAVIAIEDGPRRIVGTDYRGITVLAAYQPIAHTPWLLVAKEDRGEALGDVRWVAASSVALVALLIVILGVALRLRARTQRLNQVNLLADQEREFHEVLDHAADGMLITDDNGRITYANPRASVILGHPQPALQGRNWQEVIPYDQEDNHAPVTDDHTRYVREILLDNRGFGRKVVELTGATLPLGRFVLNLRDISERIKLQSELQFREQRFKDFSESSADWYWETDGANRFTYLSDNVFPVWGMTATDFIGRPRTELIIAGKHYSPEALDEHLARLANHQPFRHFEYGLKLPDGRIEWLSVSGVPFYTAGIFSGYRGVGQIITERRRIETELAEHRDNLEKLVEVRSKALESSLAETRLILESCADGIIEVDQDGVILLVNPAACAMLGYDQVETLLGRSLHEAAHHHYPDGTPYPEEKCPLHTALREGRHFREAHTVYWKADGQPLPIQLAAHPMQQDGAVIGAVVSFTDISQRLAIEAERERALQAAKAATQAKSLFLANMSHEIRTPMNAILGFTHLLRRDDVTPEQAEKLGRIAGAAEHLLSVINDILDISKIEAGKIELEKIDFELDSMMRRVTSIIALRTQAKGIELVVDTAGLPAHLNGDPTRLSQALINYLGNAVKFTEQGTIILRGKVLAETAADFLIRFDVEDTGAGMDPAQMAKVFNSFEQGDVSTTRQYGGTGLGLAITKHIAELMGGEVGVTSRLGQGSVFWMTARLAKAAPRVAPPANPPVLSGRRILVADDHPVTQMVHTQLARKLGMRPTSVISGKEAIAAITVAETEGDPYDVVVMDLYMPDMDGITSLQRIREQGLKKLPLFILVTGSAEVEVVERARAAGYADVLAKPIGIAQLQACLSEQLDTMAPPVSPNRESVEVQLRRHRGARILVAEDEPINQMITREILEDIGLSVTIAENGRAALELIQQQPFDLFLTDMQMPVMDGISATRAVRALATGGHIPIIAMTANAFSEDRANCLAAGMDDFVAKPVEPEILYGVLLKWLTQDKS